MQITKNGKELPKQVINGYSTNIDGANYSLSIYRSPKKMKGNANLMIGDDLWVKFASTGRVRKLSSSAKKNSSGGSDFSYVDMGSGGEGMAFNYDAKLVGEVKVDSVENYEIELIPTQNNESGYEKLLIYITKNEYLYTQIKYFKDNSNIKTLTFSDYRDVEGVKYPFKMSMKSHIKESVTELLTTKIEFNSEKVKESIFNTNYLKKIK